MSIAPPRNPARRRLIWMMGGVLLFAGILGGVRAFEAWERRQLIEYKSRCRTAVDQQNWDELVAISREWSQWDPESADAWLFLGEGLLQTGEPEQALETVGNIPRNDPKVIPALLKKIEVEFDLLNRPLVAEDTCLELLQIEPRVAEAHARLIFFYALTLQRVKLIEQIREAIRRGSEPPEAYVYLLLCDHLYFTNGYQLNAKWLQSSPNSELFQIAAAVQFDEIMQRLENQTEATKRTRSEHRLKLEAYLQQYPRNTTLLRYFLHRYAEESRVEDVARILEMIPPEAGDDSVFWRFRGWYHAAVNDLDRAHDAYRKSLELTATDWRNWQGIAEVLRLRGDLPESERCQKLALTGKNLRQELLQLPTAGDITDDQLQRIAKYADECGDREIAVHLKQRVRQRLYGD